MYNILKWNRKYGNGAKFIVRDNSTNKQAEFSPNRPKDVAWVKNDLTKESEYKGWDDFQEEPVENLSLIVM